MLSSQVIIWMIVCCVVFVVFLFFGKPFRVLARTVAGSFIGGLCMVIFNFLLTPFGVSVGINAITLLIAGILGIPGFLMLYISSVVL